MHLGAIGLTRQNWLCFFVRQNFCNSLLGLHRKPDKRHTNTLKHYAWHNSTSNGNLWAPVTENIKSLWHDRVGGRQLSAEGMLAVISLTRLTPAIASSSCAPRRTSCCRPAPNFVSVTAFAYRIATAICGRVEYVNGQLGTVDALVAK